MPISEHEREVRKVANTIAALIMAGEDPPKDEPLLALIWDKARADLKHRRKVQFMEQRHRKLMAWYSDRIEEQFDKMDQS